MTKIAYVGMSSKLNAPGDRRRFSGYAKSRLIKIEKFNEKKKYDLIVLSQMADLSFFLNYNKKNSKIIFDFVDAYLNEEFSFKKIFRGIVKYLTFQNRFLYLNYSSLLKRICSKSDYVICTTNSQKKEILKYSKNVEIILDAQDDDFIKDYKFEHTLGKKNKKLNILWEGQPGNIKSLKAISDLFKFYLNRNLINLHLLTDFKYNLLSGTNLKGNTKKLTYSILGTKKNIYFHKWNKNNLNKMSKICDIGILPIVNFKKGIYANKPANKIHLMWKLGLPVLSSPSAANKFSILSSKINLVCKNKYEWKNKIDFFIKKKNENKILIKKIGKKLRNYAYANYSNNIIFNKWDKVLKNLNIKF